MPLASPRSRALESPRSTALESPRRTAWWGGRARVEVEENGIRSELEQRVAKHEAALAAVVRECAYLRQHVSLLEARFELSLNGLRGSASAQQADGHQVPDIADLQPQPAFSSSDVFQDSKEHQRRLDVHDKAIQDLITSQEEQNEKVLSALQLQKVLNHPDLTYELQESIWDLAFLIGLPGTGFVYVVLLAVLNCAMQFLLCCIINDVFTPATIDETHATGMRQWRVFFGHSLDNMNPFSNEPYVKDVCMRKVGMRFYSEAADIVNAIAQYSPEFGDYQGQRPIVGPFLPHLEHIGMLMSAVAEFVWLMSICVSMVDIRRKSRSIVHIPVGPKTDIMQEPSSFKVVCFTWSRKLFCYFTITIETCITCLIGFSGTYYIVRTLSLRDLLLNCTALSIVLDLDELFYAAFAPMTCRHLVSNLEGLPRPKAWDIMGMSETSLIAVLLTLVGMSAAVWELNVQYDKLMAVRDEICGGHLDFVAAVDKAGILSAGVNEGQRSSKDSYYVAAMQQLILNEDGSIVNSRLTAEDMSSHSTGVAGAAYSLTEWSQFPLEKVMAFWNPQCIDMLPLEGNTGPYPYAKHFADILSEAIGKRQMPDIRLCTDVKQYCNNDDLKGVRVRQVCPVTCGCDDPGPTLILLGDNGCSPACHDTASFRSSLNSRECKDLEPTSPFWSQYADNYLAYLGPEMVSATYTAHLARQEADKLTSYGCGLLQKINGEETDFRVHNVSWLDPCESSYTNLKPFTWACPISCFCREVIRPLCPRKCN